MPGLSRVPARARGPLLRRPPQARNIGCCGRRAPVGGSLLWCTHITGGTLLRQVQWWWVVLASRNMCHHSGSLSTGQHINEHLTTRLFDPWPKSPPAASGLAHALPPVACMALWRAGTPQRRNTPYSKPLRRQKRPFRWLCWLVLRTWFSLYKIPYSLCLLFFRQRRTFPCRINRYPCLRACISTKITVYTP